MTVAKDSLGCGSIQPFGQHREHNSNLLRGGFQTIQGGVASGRESAVAGLTAKRLDALGTAMRAISHQCMDASISDAEVRALVVRTGEASVFTSLGLPVGFSPQTRGARVQRQISPWAKECRPDDRRDNRLGSAAMPQTMERGALGPCS